MVFETRLQTKDSGLKTNPNSYCVFARFAWACRFQMVLNTPPECHLNIENAELFLILL